MIRSHRADLDGPLDAVDRVELGGEIAELLGPDLRPQRLAARRAGAGARDPSACSIRRSSSSIRGSAPVRRLTSRVNTTAAAGAPPITEANDPSSALDSRFSLSARENTTNAPPWKREITQNAIGPSKLTIARPISAPYSSCRRRIDSGDPSNPARLASTTSGRLPEAALIARAIFLEASGNSVPDVHWSGPSAGTGPWRASGRDSIPSIATGQPPRCASQATATSASCIPFQRSRGGWSSSATARITERMSNGFLRPGLVSSAKICPTVCRSDPAHQVRRRADVPVRRVARTSAAGEALARRHVGVLVVGEQDLAGAGDVRAPGTGPGRWGP